MKTKTKLIYELVPGDRVRLADGEFYTVTAVKAPEYGHRYFWTDKPHWLGGDSIHCYSADQDVEVSDE